MSKLDEMKVERDYLKHFLAGELIRLDGYKEKLRYPKDEAEEHYYRGCVDTLLKEVYLHRCLIQYYDEWIAEEEKRR